MKYIEKEMSRTEAAETLKTYATQEWVTKYEPDENYIRFKINIQKYKKKDTISDYATHYVSVRKEDLV